MNTRLILIRHGESQANRLDLFAGNYDADLQNKGVAQARATAKYVSENYSVDKIYSSDLRRAYGTAQEIASELKLEIEKAPRMREISAGEWEGMKFSDIAEKYPKEYEIWANHIGFGGCPGGESVEELGKRIMSELSKIAEENGGKTVLIATHATPIRVSQCLITYGTLEKMENVPWVSNASVTIYDYENGKWSVEAVSIDSHLEGLKTFLPSDI